jgi:hypothetical protein
VEPTYYEAHSNLATLLEGQGKWAAAFAVLFDGDQLDWDGELHVQNVKLCGGAIRFFLTFPCVLLSEARAEFTVNYSSTAFALF